MQEILKILQDVKSTSGKNAKINMLSEHSDNTLLKIILKFSFDPFVKTGLSSKKINKSVKVEPSFELSDVINCMNYLSDHPTGTDQDIANIQNFLNKQSSDLAELYTNVFTKNLILGCNVSTLNKAFGNDFIVIHKVQHADSFRKVKLKPDEWFSLSEKLNGVRGSYRNGKFYSRQGHEISGLDHIINDIKNNFTNMLFIDGELIRKNTENIPDEENFRLTRSILSTDGADKSQIEFVIFDVFDDDEFLIGESEDAYKFRLNDLYFMRSVIEKHQVKNLRIVDILYSGADQTMIDFYLKLMTSLGKEGIILNRDTPYKCKKNTGILKVKEFLHCDVFCTDIQEGNNDFAGTLGSIIVDYKGYPCGVGSGFDLPDRKKYWDNPELIIGKIIQVKYKEETGNKKGGLSMQFPVFECIRDDKTESSYEV